ncbi:MAG: hypothetical protein IPN71_14455 [Fibrobacteres bacterium]|nr:hypothetical protein [Fibrobacterota bacterium]
MSQKAISLLLIAGSTSILWAKSTEKPNRKELAGIIEQIPRQEDISHYRALISPEKKTPVLTAYEKDADLKQATEGIENLKIAIPKLRNLLIVGASVFDYPGLLSRGVISYDENGDIYCMYVGAYFRKHEGSGPYDFRLFFDRMGKITAVETVVYKN